MDYYKALRPAWQALGPNGEDVAALIARAQRLTPDEIERLSAAGSAAGSAARSAARSAAWSLVARDLITPEQFDTLYGPWASVMEEHHG